MRLEVSVFKEIQPYQGLAGILHPVPHAYLSVVKHYFNVLVLLYILICTNDYAKPFQSL